MCGLAPYAGCDKQQTSHTMNHGIGYTYIEEFKKDHHDLRRFAAAFAARRVALEQDDAYSYDRFIAGGSDAAGLVGSDANSASRRYIWGTNHYLGLNRHPAVIAAAVEATITYGTGAGTSSVSGGRCALHVELEDFLRDFYQKPGVVLYSTGYTANLGLLSTIVQKNDLVLSDQENHASIIDGLRLNRCQKLTFDHNSLPSLRERLEATRGKHTNTFVVVESVYSMSGDLAPLRELVDLKREFGFLLYVDEAHAFGLYGAGGRGLCDEMGVLDEVDFLVSTFSKSTASIGGFCVFGDGMRTFITLRSSSYLFQASFPPAAAATILASLRLFSKDDSFASSLHEKSYYMRDRLTEAGFDLGTSQSPIIPIYVTDVSQLYNFEQELYRRGVFAVSVTYPAVKPTEGRIRLIVNDAHSYADIDATVDVLSEIGSAYGVVRDAVGVSASQG